MNRKKLLLSLCIYFCLSVFFLYSSIFYFSSILLSLFYKCRIEAQFLLKFTAAYSLPYKPSFIGFSFSAFIISKPLKFVSYTFHEQHTSLQQHLNQEVFASSFFNPFYSNAKKLFNSRVIIHGNTSFFLAQKYFSGLPAYDLLDTLFFKKKIFASLVPALWKLNFVYRQIISVCRSLAKFFGFLSSSPKICNIHESIQNEYDDLIKKLNKCILHYYEFNESLVTDLQFDFLLQRLLKIERDYPSIISQDSPSIRVGSKLTHSNLPKRKHIKPVLSLDNAFNETDLTTFIKKITKVANLNEKHVEMLHKHGLVLEKKIDGLCCVLKYKKIGNYLFFMSATTRGDGYVGEDITNNIKLISNIPKIIYLLNDHSENNNFCFNSSATHDHLIYKTGINIILNGSFINESNTQVNKDKKLVFDKESIKTSMKENDEPVDSCIEVRGEVYMDKETFFDLNKRRIDSLLEPFSNPRNAASAYLRSTHLNEEKHGVYVNFPLKFFAFEIICTDKFLFNNINIFYSKISNDYNNFIIQNSKDLKNTQNGFTKKQLYDNLPGLFNNYKNYNKVPQFNLDKNTSNNTSNQIFLMSEIHRNNTKENEIEKDFHVGLTHIDILEKLKEWHFDVIEHIHIQNKSSYIEEINNYVNYFNDIRNTLPYNIDGMVIKVNSLALREKLGTTSRSPRWQFAIKLKSKTANTVIRDIIVQVGRTGILTPVAILKPFMLDTVKINRATLHNADEIMRKDIRVGDTVEVKRAGDVIPQVVRVDLNQRLPNSSIFKFPVNCPVCNSKIIRTEGEAHRRCSSGNSCEAQAIQKICRFVSRDAFNIKGLGVKTIEWLYISQLVAFPYEIFLLKQKVKQIFGYKNLEDCEGWGKTSAKNIYASIENSKNIKLNKFIYALGIRYVGLNLSNALANHFKTYKKFYKYVVALREDNKYRKIVNDNDSFCYKNDFLSNIQKNKYNVNDSNSNTTMNMHCMSINKDNEAILKDSLCIENFGVKTSNILKSYFLNDANFKQLILLAGKPSDSEEIENSEKRTFINKNDIISKIIEIKGQTNENHNAKERQEVEYNGSEINPDKMKGIVCVEDFIQTNSNSGFMSGIEVVFTGQLKSMKRLEAQKMAKSVGAVVSRDITKNTNLLVKGKRYGSKVAKAEKLGIKILDEDAWLHMMNKKNEIISTKNKSFFL